MIAQKWYRMIWWVVLDGNFMEIEELIMKVADYIKHP